MLKVLKVLNGEIERAVTREERHKKLAGTALTAIGRTTPDNVCGFEIPAELIQADRIVRDRDVRLNRIAFYRDDAKRLCDQLAAAGVEPLAVITAKAFDALIAEMGLFTLKPSESGAVDVNRGAIVGMKRSDSLATSVSFLVAIALIPAFLWAFCQWGWSVRDSNEGGPVFGAAVLLGIVTLASSVFAARIDDTIKGWLFQRRAAAWIASKSWEEILDALSTKRTFTAPNFESESYGAFQRTILLPQAPPDIIDKVCRIARHNVNAQHKAIELYVAAEAGAISFKNGLDGLFDLRAVNAQLAAEERARRDPILFVRGSQGGAVAIIAQYGDLPLERATIKKIVNSEHLL